MWWCNRQRTPVTTSNHSEHQCSELQKSLWASHHWYRPKEIHWWPGGLQMVELRKQYFSLTLMFCLVFPLHQWMQCALWQCNCIACDELGLGRIGHSSLWLKLKSWKWIFLGDSVTHESCVWKTLKNTGGRERRQGSWIFGSVELITHTLEMAAEAALESYISNQATQVWFFANSIASADPRRPIKLSWALYGIWKSLFHYSKEISKSFPDPIGYGSSYSVLQSPWALGKNRKGPYIWMAGKSEEKIILNLLFQLNESVYIQWNKHILIEY